MTDYTTISKFRNKGQCDFLAERLKEKGKTCYNFCSWPVDPENPSAPLEEQMKAFESVEDFYNDEYY